MVMRQLMVAYLKIYILSDVSQIFLTKEIFLKDNFPQEAQNKARDDNLKRVYLVCSTLLLA